MPADVKRFLIRLSLFCPIPVLLLFFMSYVVDMGLYRSRYHFRAVWNDLFDGRINADLIVMGTSRAYVHVSPAILDTALNVNAYNLGMDGASFDLQNAILKLYLQHNKKPRYIIQEVGYPTFVTSDPAQYYLELVPYIHDSAVWTILKKECPYIGFAEHYVPMYKYIDMQNLVDEGKSTFIGQGQKDLRYKGYEEHDFQWDSTFYNMKCQYPHGRTIPLDSAVIAEFEAYLSFCEKNGIQVILLYPPSYYEARPYILNFEQMHQMFIGIAAKHHLPFLDHTEDSMSYNKTYFYNSQHLNKMGAELFSQNLARELQSIIKNQR